MLMFWKRRAPTNYEDPSKHILNILDMRSMSTRKHEWHFGSYLPEKMKSTFGNFGINKRSPDGQGLKKSKDRGGGPNLIFCGPKQLASPNVLNSNGKYDGGVLVKLRNKTEVNHTKSNILLKTMLHVFE